MYPKHVNVNALLYRGLSLFLLMFLIGFISVPGSSESLETSTSFETSESQLETFSLNNGNNPVIDIPGNSSKIQVQAGDLTRLRLRDQLQINLSLQEHAELNINISDSNPAGPLPANTYRFQNFYRFELNQSTGLQANFAMPFDHNQLPSDVTPQMLSWAYFNNYSHSWEYVYSWLNEEQNLLMTQTNHFSTWAILSNPENNPVTPIVSEGNGTTIKLKSQQQYQIRLQSKFQLNVSFGDDVEFSLNESDSVPFQYTFENHLRYGNFWSLETNNSLAELNATFGFPYDFATLPDNVDPAQLRFYYFNTSMNQWQMAYSWVTIINIMKFMTNIN